MKKQYVTPALATQWLASEETLNGVSSPGRGISYGGVDTDGTKDPAARERSAAEEASEWSKGLW